MAPPPADLAQAVARAVSFAATVPLMPKSTEPRSARVALALVLIPVLWQASPPAATGDPVVAAACGAVTGTALGLSACVIASAVVAAGGLIDAALGSPPFAAHVPSAGPIALIYQLGWAAVFFQSGGLTTMVSTLVRAERDVPFAAFSGHEVAALAALCTRGAVALAGPQIFAQALATVAAGIFSRAAPQLGGVLLGTSWSPAAVLVATTVGAATVWPSLAHLVVASGAALARIFDP